MRLKEVEQRLGAKATWDCERAGCENREVRSCHASDLMSDVLTFRGPGSLLLTGLTNPQVIRTAEMSDFAAICLVRGKQPQPETIRLAQEKGLPLFVTRLSMYEACGQLFELGLSPGARGEVAGRCQGRK